MEILLCTGNPGKAAELRALLPEGTTIITLREAGLPDDLPETGSTLEANALQKAWYAYERTGKVCVADDTGLEVRALEGRPGVLSARYAGPAKDPARNMMRLLEELDGKADRSARFRTVIALVHADGEELFEGVVNGHIALEQHGEAGFGYDPLFLPEGERRTFAQMTLAEKNAMSHRARAVHALVERLRKAPLR
ncbi:MAG TPA: RdgB/HAM1 family non-canonical purine NTP pyrophosphatase [Flavobacteriales bacterium]